MKAYVYRKNIYIFIIILAIPFYLSCCKTKVNELQGSFMTKKVTTQNLSPLTHEMFLNIRNNITPFSFLYLVYQKDDGYYVTQFQITAGSISNAYYMNSFETFLGGIIKFHNNPITFEKHEHGKPFTYDDVSLILNYLEQNNEYFFDGSEFSGLPIPYESTKPSVCMLNYNFILSFDDIDDGKDCWGIYKCLDEYPAPDHPLYALFQLLEEHFISQFEEP